MERKRAGENESSKRRATPGIHLGRSDGSGVNSWCVVGCVKTRKEEPTRVTEKIYIYIYIDISLSSFKRDRERWREGSKGGDLGIWVGGDTCNFSGSSIQRALTRPCRWWGADVSGFDCEVDL